jgi:hypothetical protein
MNYQEHQSLLPFALRGKQKTANGASAKPVRFRFHRYGSISVRVDGSWHRQQTLSPSLYLSVPGRIREQISKAEARRQERTSTTLQNNTHE